jgi:hypothetical protein
MENVKVTAVKGFLNGNEYVPRRRSISVGELRARELEAGGLVVREKKAPEPKNKMDGEPQNKASRKAKE